MAAAGRGDPGHSPADDPEGYRPDSSENAIFQNVWIHNQFLLPNMNLFNNLGKASPTNLIYGNITFYL